jgi:hypothetical protein
MPTHKACGDAAVTLCFRGILDIAVGEAQLVLKQRLDEVWP